LFGKKLKEKREEKDYSKKDIDKMMGTNTAYAWWEGRNYLGEFKIQLPDNDNYKKLKEILELDDDMDFIFKKAEREIIGQYEKTESYKYKNNNVYQINGNEDKKTLDITLPSTEFAKKWNGWGTALKPAYEPIIVARKPFKTSVAENIMNYGVGGINIDECRVGTDEKIEVHNNSQNSGIYGKYRKIEQHLTINGRFPANVIHDGSEEAIKDMNINENDASRYFYCAKASKKDRDEGLDMFDSIETNSLGGNYLDKILVRKYDVDNKVIGNYIKNNRLKLKMSMNDLSKMFPSKNGKITGRVHNWESGKELPTKEQWLMLKNILSFNNKYDKEMTTFVQQEANNKSKDFNVIKKNIHPTVKPIELMQYLVRMVSPRGSTILDCFMGSGSTGKAVMCENREREANYKFIGIELTEEYLPICEARIDYALNKYEYDFKKELNEAKEMGQQNIFDLIGGD
jgi:DNA modification methylase/transcriptional regulator with XRE-family HTH domain